VFTFNPIIHFMNFYNHHIHHIQFVEFKWKSNSLVIYFTC